MGFNSVLMLLNDHWGAIDQDPAGWWKEAKERLSMRHSGRLSSDRDGDFGFGYSANGFQAVWNEHADSAALIMVCANSASVVATGWWQRDGTELQLLKTFAEKHGFRLVKKSKPKDPLTKP